MSLPPPQFVEVGGKVFIFFFLGFFFLESVLIEYSSSYRRRYTLPLRIRYYSLIYSRRYYSTTNSLSQHSYGSDSTPHPILILDLNDKDCIKSHEGVLKGKGGIYSLVNTVNGKQYIGSAKDFFIPPASVTLCRE